jgi:hypothetical protein
MAKDPAVLLYTQDFLVGTLSMTDEQRGKYIYLLCLQHQKGKLTLVDLKSKLTDEDIEVAERFPLQADGFYYNQRMYDEAIKRKNYTESRRSNRTKKTNDIDVKKISQSYVNRMENENEDVNVNDNTNRNTNTEIVYTEQMKKNMIEKFAERIDNRFKLNHFIIEIDEDWGGWDNFLDICIGDDNGVKNNFNNKLNQYRNGIFK